MSTLVEGSLHCVLFVQDQVVDLVTLPHPCPFLLANSVTGWQVILKRKSQNNRSDHRLTTLQPPFSLERMSIIHMLLQMS